MKDQSYKNRISTFIYLLVFCFFFFSCRTTKQVQYLEGIIDTSALSKVNLPEPTIQKGDMIGITVFSDNVDESASFNQMSSVVPAIGFSGSVPTANQAQNMPEYLVDIDGNIHMQSVGLIKVEGLTKIELSKLLVEKLSLYLKNPYFDIRFLNYRITVLGEVNRQGVYNVPGEKITVLEALGMAGDFTIYGLKDCLIVVREIGDKRSIGILDVSSPELFLSPYYYLQQNDVVIVKANAKKPGVSEQTNARNLALVATFVTIITSVTVLLNVLLR